MNALGMFDNLENALDAAAMRQQVLANNIANAGSPNFKAQAVAFEDQLKEAMASNNNLNGDLAIRPVSIDGEDGDFDVNTKVHAKVFDTGQKVDMNQQMVMLAQNQIQYNMLADKANGMFNEVKEIINSVR